MTKEELDLFLRAEALVKEWEGKEDSRVPAEVVTEIFNTHNGIFPTNPEHGRSCTACRARTWTRLKNWYHNNKHLYI